MSKARNIADIGSHDVIETDSDGVTVIGDLTIPDKITHSGDTNTALRFPAADTVTVETVGTERVRVDSSGNVGIGTSSPQKSLVVSDGGAMGIELSPDDAGQGYSRILNFDRTTSQYEPLYIEGEDLRFSTGTSAVECMRITSSGNVGIGTSSPAADFKLDVNGAFTVGGTYSTLTSTNGGGVNIGFDGTNGGKIESLDPAFAWFPLKVGGSDLKFETIGAERMRITQAGNVGIGTSTPNYTLAVNGTFGVTNGRGYFYGSQNVGTMLNSAGSLGGIELTSAGASHAAFMTFHRPGAWASYFGLDTDNYFTVGGWSAGVGLAGFKCGPFSKTSGSFKIDHPLKPDTHYLVHSFVEGPQADNIYRGRVTLVDGSAVVNIDTVAGMTEGTFAALNRDIQCFTSNETGWCNVRGSVSGNILTIEAQDNACTDTISWLVIGERQDQHMYDTDWTDENGKVIVEPLKEQPQL